MSRIMTSAGELRVEKYDDGCAKGIKIYLDDEIVANVDVLENPNENFADGWVRIINYSLNEDDEFYDEPYIFVAKDKDE